MMPEATPRDSAGMRCAAAPNKTEKLQVPAPMAVSMPMVRIKPMLLLTKGVSAVPMTKMKMPTSKTGRGPYLSANAPAIG